MTVHRISETRSLRPPPAHGRARGVLGATFLVLIAMACIGSLPWTLGMSGGGGGGAPRYNAGTTRAGLLPPSWWPVDRLQARQLNALVDPATIERVAAAHGLSPRDALDATDGPAAAQLRAHWPRFALGTDILGRGLFVRCLAGGGISLAIGLAAALLSVGIGTTYGAIAGYAGGRVDAVMMRFVDVLYGLPYVLLVVLLAVASDAAMDEYIGRPHARAAWVQAQAQALAPQRGVPASDPGLRAELETKAFAEPSLRPREVSEGTRSFYGVVILLVAIGGVSWLTMARVVRGQVLSLKARPFMEAARAIGVPWPRQLTRHLLPNLVGPIIVYATLTIPQAILQESFLSFLGIGVKPRSPAGATSPPRAWSPSTPTDRNGGCCSSLASCSPRHSWRSTSSAKACARPWTRATETINASGPPAAPSCGVHSPAPACTRR